MSAGVNHLLTRIRQVGLPDPVTEYVFHPRRKWRMDLAWPRYHLAVEVDGSVYAQGRHTRGAGYEADCEKLNEANILGWSVLRFSTGQVTSDVAIEQLQRKFDQLLEDLKCREEPPHANHLSLLCPSAAHPRSPT